MGGRGMAATAAPADTTDFRSLLARVHEIGRTIVAPAAGDVDERARFPSESFDALRSEQLLSAYVTPQFGGMGLSVTEICRICEALGHYCASTAMVYAMHQIQVACILHHAGSSTFFGRYLRRLVDEQLLLASATTELGVGGDLRTSLCHVETTGSRFELEKKAPVISYAANADAILTTCRAAPDAVASDQVLVVVERDQLELEEIAGWDTLGFRGTCSLGYLLRGGGDVQQIIPEPFGDVLARTMHPYAHLSWSSLWLGLATDAVNRARDSVRAHARRSPSAPQVAALRLTEVDEILFEMRSVLYGTVQEYDTLLTEGDVEAFNSFGFSIRVNNVKITCSELVVDIVGRALQIVGIAAYKNDSKSSLGRHLRDAYGAALMVNNDRIRGHNATMQIAHRQS